MPVFVPKCSHGKRIDEHCSECAFGPGAVTAVEPTLGTVPVQKPKSAADYLGKAQALMIERGKQYDKPEGERSMGKAVMAFNAITGRNIRESEGWLLLQILKDVRQRQSPAFHADSAEDCVAYAALKAEALEQEQA